MWPLFSKVQVPKACRLQGPHAGQGEDTFSLLSLTPPFPLIFSISVNSGYFEL